MLKIPAVCCVLFLICSCRPVKSSKTPLATPETGTTNDSVKPGEKASLAATDKFLEGLLAAKPELFKEILHNRRALNVQIIYTQIDRKQNNKPLFKPYYFNLDANAYYYPASTVKMPIALLAMEKLRELKVAGLDRNSSMLTGSAHSGQSQVLNDPTATDGVPSISQYIRKIFLVSDNDAFNRLYEFLGQEYINRKLEEKGYSSANIYHRLSIPLTEDENRHTNPVRFIDSAGNLLYDQPAANSKLTYSKRHDTLGLSHYSGGKLSPGGFDFSKKNRFSLEDMTRVLQSVIFPESLPENQRFNISADDYRFVRQYMSQWPGEGNSPEYSKPDFWPAYCKFLYYGSDTSMSAKQGLRIFNKVGDAYGFLVDVAYFADFNTGIEFMLSATIFCDSDGIINDDKSDYTTVGYPFMKNLGRLIYEYELGRDRKHPADLSEFRMNYDKR